MWQKILGIAAVVLLVGALIGGGVYILTQSDSTHGTQAGQGREHNTGGNAGSGGGGRWEAAAGTGNTLAGGGGNRGGKSTAVSLDGGGNSLNEAGGYRGGRGAGAPVGEPAVEVGRGAGGSQGSGGEGANLAGEAIEEWVIVTGTVLEMNEELVLQSEAGEEVKVCMGPSWYRESQGTALLPGDLVRVTGFYEAEDKLEAATVENLSTGQVLSLRDEAGRPLWRGRGRWEQ